MKRMIFCLVFALMACGILLAEEEQGALKKLFKAATSPLDTVFGQAAELEKIVVTPSRLEEKLGSSSSSISVIDGQDFDRAKIDAAKDALKEEVGVDVVQAGGFQGPTSVFMRGGNSNHTLVMIDGVKAYDPISPNGAYNMAHLTLDNVGQIEVLRGPQSTLYGSDAMGGVINIISKKAEKPYVNASFEAGSFYTYQEKFEVGASSHGFHYSLSGSRLDTKGISQAQAKNNNQETDPYDRTAIAARVDYDVCDKASVGGTLRYTNAHYQYDNMWASVDDDDMRGRLDETFLTTYASLDLLEWWNQMIKLGWMRTLRRDEDTDRGAANFLRDKYSGEFFKMDYQSTFNILDIDHVVVGYEYTEEIGDSFYEDAWSVTDQAKVFSREGDLYVENRFNLHDRLTSTQGVRVGHHSRAGTFETYRIDGSYLFPTGTKVRGLFATGFKAPTLYQLFTPRLAAWWGVFGGGNSGLRPEKSVSYEYGADQYMFGDKLVASATYFHSIYRDLIDAVYHPDTGNTDQFANVGKARVHGIELSAKVKPIDSVSVRAGVTYLKTKNLQTDADLLRRPERKFFVDCFWQVVEKLSLNTRVRYNGPMADSGGYKIKEYVTVDIVLNYNITKNFSVYAKLDNAFDQHYEEVVGFGMPPIAAYGGVKGKF